MSGDTAPIRPEERFDEERVAAYLREHLPALVGGGPLEFAQFPGGRANLTYLVRAGDREFVLRRPPLGPVAPGSHDMRREHAVLSVLHRVYPAAPRAHHLCEDESVMGAPFFVMDRRRGSVVREMWPPGLPRDEAFRRRLAEHVVAALADLHLVDYPALGLGDLGRPGGFVARQVRGWVDRWQHAKHEDLPAMTDLGKRFAASTPPPQTAVLLHNDYKLDNLMVGPDAEIVGIFDWDMATIGDPLIDLGAALAYWAQPGDAMFEMFGAAGATLSPVMPRPEVVERYAARTGFDVSNVAYYHAFGVFRVAVIVQQIYVRYRRGQTGDERFGALGRLVPLLARDALAVAEGM